jgi:DNA-binding transcriptional LysR family regulator
MLNLRQMEAFRALMLTGTTIQAAAMLRVTQPAVSRLISDLEAQTGIALFARANGRLRPTPEADALFNEIEKAYVSLDHIANFMTGIHRIAGSMRLLATMPIAHGILPGAIGRFRTERPDTLVTLKTVIRRDVRSWLDTQQFDLALTNFPLDYPLEATARLARVEGVCILPPGHQLETKEVVTAADLAEQPFVAMSPETQHRLKVDAAFVEAGVTPRVVTEAQTGIIVAELVAAGIGVSVVDAITARAVSAKGIVVRPFKPLLSYEFRFLFPIQKARSREAGRFVEIVMDQVRELNFVQ